MGYVYRLSVLWIDWGQQGQSISKSQQKTLLGHLIAAARLLLAAKWKSENLPTRKEWLQKVQYMRLMDKISVLLRLKGMENMVQKRFKLCWDGMIL